MKTKDLVALFALAAVWGASYLFIRIAAPALGPFPLAGGRVALAGLVLWLGMRAAGQRPAIRENARKLLILGGLNAAIPFSLIAAAELHVTASLAAMLTATAPMWSAVFSALWLGERIGARRGAGLVLGVCGVAVLVGWSAIEMTTTAALSIVAILVATCSYVIATIYAKRNLAGVPAPTLALGQQLGAAVLLAVPAAIRVPQAQPTTTAVLALAALVVFCTVIAYLLYFRLVASIGPTKLSTVTYIIPVFGMAWGALFLGEPVTRGMIAGLALILVSVVLVNEVRLGRLLRLRRSVPA